MKKFSIYILFLIGALAAFAGCGKNNGAEQNDVIAVTNAAVEWQREAYPNMNEQRRWVAYGDLSWENAIYITAVAEWAQFTENADLLDWCKMLADTNHYQLSNLHGLYFADDLCVGSFYAQIFRATVDSSVLMPTYERLKAIVNNPSEMDLTITADKRCKDRWSWCDALYMAPPVFAEYANIFHDQSLLDFMNSEYWTTYNKLYSPTDSLFFRDSNYFSKLEANGQKVFWGRGNAWVFAGLARLIPLLPDTMPDYDKYIQLYNEMAVRLAKLQHEDGYWRASLLDPDSYPAPEMSCTTFYTFAFWWGINNGLLNTDDFLPVAEKGWRSIVAHVHENGKLGSVQPVGEDPKAITEDMTEVYGPAAMSMAAHQILLHK